MRHRGIGGAAAVAAAAFVLSACGSSTEVVPIPTPPATPPATVSGGTGSAAADPLARFAEQHVKWRDCGGEAQCTHVLVPLDYADPQGATIRLSVTRVPARGEERLGSLFVNPGGPGGSAFDYAKAADYIVSEGVRDAYDIVGVDPRGVGRSAPVECLTDAQRDAILALDATPDSPADEQALVAGSLLPAQECAANEPETTPHVGTVNVARDHDIVRAVLGDPAFTYLGKSYGTSIGAVYADLFPARVGRMVLDGVLPPAADLEEISLGQALGFEEALDDFARDCAGRRDCPFAGDGPQVRRSLVELLQSLDTKPITSEGRLLNEAVATYAVLSYLYFPPGDYEQLREGLRSIVDNRDAGPMFAMLDARISRNPDGTYADNSTDAFYAITCVDNPTDVTVDRVRELASRWSAEAPVFGEPLAWGLLSCNGWPRPDGLPAAPASAGQRAPILVVSTRHDPATPYQWGVDLARSLGNAALVSWDAHHHTAYGEGSACVDEAVDAYLLRGTVPTGDRDCPA